MLYVLDLEAGLKEILKYCITSSYIKCINLSFRIGLAVGMTLFVSHRTMPNALHRRDARKIYY